MNWKWKVQIQVPLGSKTQVHTASGEWGYSFAGFWGSNLQWTRFEWR
jgi:hypothetical protein